jgi:hypothetical protein
MYMPGRRLTASRPSRTWIELASYVLLECLVAALAPKEDPPHLMFREINKTVLFVEGLHRKIVTQLFPFPNGRVWRFAFI